MTISADERYAKDPIATAAPRSRLTAPGLGALLALAAVLRLFDLGGIGFYGAEDYVVLAERGIQEHGAPVTPSGAIYPRAVAYSYLVAASVRLFGESEWAVRLPGALLSTAAVGVAWALARLAFGPAVALLVGLLMALCDWEIATARTARMYGPLSCSALVLMWLVARQLVYGPSARVRWAIVAGAFTGTLHLISLALAPALAVLPILPMSSLRERARLALPTAALVASGLMTGVVVDHYYASVDAITAVAAEQASMPAAASDAAPTADAAPRASEPLRFGATVLLAVFAGVLVQRRTGPEPWVALASALVLAALLFGRPLLAVYVWLGLAALAPWRPAAVGGRNLMGLALVIGAGSLACFAMLELEGVPLREAVRKLLLRPRNFLQLFALRTPAVFALAGATALHLLRAPALDGRSRVGLLVVAAWVVPATLLGLHPNATNRFHERYEFFLNPYMLILYAAAVWWLATRAAAWRGNATFRPVLRGVLAVVLLLATGGIDVTASLAAMRPHYGANEQLLTARGEPTFFADHAGTARFVCTHAGLRDQVIVTDSLGHALYCPRLDHQLTVRPDRDADAWLGGSRNRSSVAALLDALEAEPAERIWFVVSQEERQLRQQGNRREELERLLAANCVRRAHLSRDGVSAVYVWDWSCQPSLRAAMTRSAARP